jgi:peptidoglycan/LPS O-acetylase OafA/YrhL
MGLGFFRLVLSIWVIDHHFGWSRTYIEPPLVARFGVENFGYLGIGHISVMAFFVLSGYVITWVLNNKYPANGIGVKAFLVGRFIRIYPLYWTIITVIAVVFYLTAVPGVERPQLEIERLIGDYLLIPYGIIGFFYFFNRYAYGMIDVPAWTLPYDMVFYLIAPWVVLRKRILATIIVLELVYVVVLSQLGPQYFDGWHEAYFTTGHATLLAFCVGALAYYYRQVVIHDSVLIGATLALLYFAFAPYGLTNLYINHVLVIAVSTVLVLALKKRSPLDNLFSELTYSTYLLHLPVYEVLSWFEVTYASVWALFMTYVMAFAVVKYFEAPLERKRAALTAVMLQGTAGQQPVAPLAGGRWVAGMLFVLIVVSGVANLWKVGSL